MTIGLKHKVFVTIDAFTGFPYNWMIWRMLWFLYNILNLFGNVKCAPKFIDMEHLVKTGVIALKKDVFDKWIRERHNDFSLSTKALVGKYYGEKAVKFLEKYI